MEKTNGKKIRPRSHNAESNFIIDTICDTICGELKQGMKVLNSINDTNLKMLNLLQQLVDGKKVSKSNQTDNITISSNQNISKEIGLKTELSASKHSLTNANERKKNNKKGRKITLKVNPFKSNEFPAHTKKKRIANRIKDLELYFGNTRSIKPKYKYLEAKPNLPEKK